MSPSSRYTMRRWALMVVAALVCGAGGWLIGAWMGANLLLPWSP